MSAVLVDGSFSASLLQEHEQDEQTSGENLAKSALCSFPIVSKRLDWIGGGWQVLRKIPCT
jgi:hypothetical protein